MRDNQFYYYYIKKNACINDLYCASFYYSMCIICYDRRYVRLLSSIHSHRTKLVIKIRALRCIWNKHSAAPVRQQSIDLLGAFWRLSPRGSSCYDMGSVKRC